MAARSKSLLSSFSRLLVTSCAAGPLWAQGGLAPFCPLAGGRKSQFCVPAGPGLGVGRRDLASGASPQGWRGDPPICNPRTYTSHRHTAPLISHTHSTTHPVSLTPHTPSPLPTPHIPHMHTHTPSHTLQHIRSQTPHHSHRRHTHSHTHHTICSTDSHPITHAHTPSTHTTHTLPHILSHTPQLSHHISYTSHTRTPHRMLSHSLALQPALFHRLASHHTHRHPTHTYHTYTTRHATHSHTNSLQATCCWICWLSFQFTHPRE